VLSSVVVEGSLLLEEATDAAAESVVLHLDGGRVMVLMEVCGDDDTTLADGEL